MLITSREDAIRAALSQARAPLLAVLLTDSSGQPLGMDGDNDLPPDTFEALADLARRVIDRQTGLVAAKARTIEFFDWEGRQVICRAFLADDRPWLLAALTPPQKSYKQALTKLIKRLQAILNPKLS